jgi:hypothetical protein
VRLPLLAVAITYVAAGQERIELTASVWRIGATGTLQSGIVPVDLQSDLRLTDKFAFAGRVVVFPKQRHGIVIESSRVTLDGDNELARTIVFNGRTYDVRDRIRAAAELTTVYAGYQYSVLSRPGGRLAFGGGGAYISASGDIRSVSTGVQAAREQRIGLVLASMDARARLLPGTNLLEIAGDLKGMSFGRYGRYVQGGVHGGVNFGRVGFRAGYLVLDADIHEGSSPSDVGIAPRLAGPAFSLVFRH